MQFEQNRQPYNIFGMDGISDGFNLRTWISLLLCFSVGEKGARTELKFGNSIPSSSPVVDFLCGAGLARDRVLIAAAVDLVVDS